MLILGLLLWTPLSLFMLWRARVFQPRSIVGPSRLAPGEYAVLLPIMLLVAVGVGGVATAGVLRALGPSVQWQNYIANIVFMTVTTLVVAAANLLVRQDGPQRAGLTLRHAARSLRGGLIGFLGIFPIVLLVGLGVTALHLAMDWPQPEPHDLLKTLGMSDTVSSKLLLVLMAVVVAPVSEEILFRGLIQTFLVRAFSGRSGVVPPRGFEAIETTAPLDDAGTARVGAVEAAAPVAIRRRVQVTARWAGVGVTAALFALVHTEPAFFPPLFILALGMGYAYERTGNLWVPIVMHAAFNGVQITLFLIGIAR